MSQFPVRSVEDCHEGDNFEDIACMARSQKKINFFQHVAQFGRKLRNLTNEEMFLTFPNTQTFFGKLLMASGTIKRLTDRGFGFIDTGGPKDLFFHSSNVQGTTYNELFEGQQVTFDETMGPKGPCAENVTPDSE